MPGAGLLRLNPDHAVLSRDAEADAPPRAGECACLCRRQLLGGSVAATLSVFGSRARADDTDAEREARPKAGDLFVFMAGDRHGEVIAPADIKLDATQTLAWPYDPDKKVPRDGSRYNQVMLIRLDPASLSEAEKPRAAEGIVAFSAVCTHAGCTITAWMPKEGHFQCPCHQSEFDPRDGGKAVFGPAPRGLAALPLKISDGKLAAAGGFIGRVGIAPAG